MNAFTLFALLKLDKSEYDKSMSDAEKEGKSFGSKLGTAAKVGAAAVAAVGTAAVTASKALYNGAQEVASYGDNIDKMSQKIGISAEAYQEWDAVFQHSGANVNSLQQGMRTLNTQLNKVKDAASLAKSPMAQLGFSLEEVEEMAKDPDKALENVIYKLQELPAGAERSALATQLLGRSGVELGALLNQTAEDTKKMKDRVHELGGVMSNEAVKASAQFQDNMQDLHTALDGLKRNILSKTLPAFNTLIDKFTNMIAGGDGFSGVIGNITDKLGNVIEKILPRLGDLFERLIPKLLDMAEKILPVILDVIADIAPIIVDVVEELLPPLLDLLKEILPPLGDLLKELLPPLKTILSAVVDLLKTIIPPLTDIIKAIMPILIDLINILSPILETICSILTPLIQLVLDLIKPLLELIHNILQPLTDMFSGVGDTLKNVLGPAIDFVGGLLNNLLGPAFEAIGGIVSSVVSLVTGDWEGLADALEGIWTGLKDFAAKIWGEIGNIVDSAVEGILGDVNAARDAALAAQAEIQAAYQGKISQNSRNYELYGSAYGITGQESFASSNSQAAIQQQRAASAASASRQAAQQQSQLQQAATYGGYTVNVNIAGTKAASIASDANTLKNKQDGGRSR